MKKLKIGDEVELLSLVGDKLSKFLLNFVKHPPLTISFIDRGAIKGYSRPIPDWHIYEIKNSKGDTTTYGSAFVMPARFPTKSKT